MSDAPQSAIEAARRRLRIAEEKYERQLRRFAMRAVDGDAAAKVLRVAMEEAEAELEASRDALRRLEQAAPD